MIQKKKSNWRDAKGKNLFTLTWMILVKLLHSLLLCQFPNVGGQSVHVLIAITGQRLGLRAKGRPQHVLEDVLASLKQVNNNTDTYIQKVTFIPDFNIFAAELSQKNFVFIFIRVT